MNDNYGDFLLYYAAVNKASKVREDLEIISADVSETYDEYITVNRETKYSAILNCDAALLAGGGYFSEPPTRKLYWNLRYLIKHAFPLLLLNSKRIPYAILGVGAGPMSYPFTRYITKKIFNKASTVSVRDEESKEFLKSIGVKNEISVVPDWVMGMDTEELVRENESRKIKEIIKNFDQHEKIYVHLTTKNDERNPGMEIVIQDLIKYSEQNSNARFIIGCDQSRESQENRAKEIVDRFSPDKVMFFPYSGPWMLSSMLNQIDMVVTDKLHVGIVGTRLGKFVISVPYHTKTLRFYNQLGLSDRSKMLKEISKEEVYKLMSNYENKDIKNLASIIKQSKTNYNLLEKYIKGIN